MPPWIYLNGEYLVNAAVRTALAQPLQPRLRRKGATNTHAALLQLASCREGALRLVTTNFDRVFERTAQRGGLTFHVYAAPMLPIPKNSRWDGLVYLHGLFPERVNDSALQRLVVTSGDFGLAYAPTGNQLLRPWASPTHVRHAWRSRAFWAPSAPAAPPANED